MSAASGLFSPRLLVHLLALRPFLRVFFGLNIIGRENLAGLDRFILAANHNSHLDTPLLYAALPINQILRTHPVAAAEYFSRSRLVFRTVDFLFRPVWIERDGPAARSVAKMKERLASGRNLIIFPEGSRGEPGTMAEFKKGIDLVAAAHPDLPIVPAFLSGTERALPRKSLVPLPVWNTIVIGPPQLHRGRGENVAVSLRACIEELARAHGSRTGPARARPSFTLAVLGIDGSGKSTLARSLALEMSAASRCCLVGDRLEMYEEGRAARFQPLPSERLRGAVGAYARRARSLGSYKIPKLAELLLRDHLLKEARTWYRPELLVLDGSPLLNLAAWAGLYSGRPLDAESCAQALRILTSGGAAAASSDPIYTRFPELAALASLGLGSFDAPDAVLLLDVEPAEALARITSRGSEIQAHETPELLERLRRGYLTLCDVLELEFRIPCRKLDGSRPRGQVLEAAAEALKLARRDA